MPWPGRCRWCEALGESPANIIQNKMKLDGMINVEVLSEEAPTEKLVTHIVTPTYHDGGLVSRLDLDSLAPQVGWH